MEEARQGRDAATLEVVMEAAGPLTYSQLEGLGVHAGQALRQLGQAAHPQLWQFSCHIGGLAATLTLASGS